jgi:ketosteroid isomerase-like protein
MTRCVSLSIVALLAAVALSAAEAKPDLQAQVRETEKAFAKTMADRDHAAFVSFVAEDAVFLAKSTPLRGRQAVADGWKPYFATPAAPFSWEPERVEVALTGKLAVSTGPVRNPKGERVGTFVSTWRLEADGKWRIVLDMGCPACECPPKPQE